MLVWFFLQLLRLGSTCKVPLMICLHVRYNYPMCGTNIKVFEGEKIHTAVGLCICTERVHQSLHNLSPAMQHEGKPYYWHIPGRPPGKTMFQSKHACSDACNSRRERPQTHSDKDCARNHSPFFISGITKGCCLTAPDGL